MQCNSRHMTFMRYEQNRRIYNTKNANVWFEKKFWQHFNRTINPWNNKHILHIYIFRYRHLYILQCEMANLFKLLVQFVHSFVNLCKYVCCYMASSTVCKKEYDWYFIENFLVFSIIININYRLNSIRLFYILILPNVAFGFVVLFCGLHTK